ncbi:hypothetical protein FF041_30300 [Streptomyces jumonjinensis]|uniref:Uncharacterized protein n=1 Tax=Streptomyces jumonjinensis TaxID=1945 RepID=A0A646KPQ1_STRJU|nr:hypothetical protein [Streptomyces jumonjinensis]
MALAAALTWNGGGIDSGGRLWNDGGAGRRLPGIIVHSPAPPGPVATSPPGRPAPIAGRPPVL